MVYIVFAIYTTSTVLFDKTFADYLRIHGGTNSESWMNVLYTPWIFKPLYGFLSDKYFMFKYRVKGYAILFAFSTMLTTIAIYFVVDMTSDSRVLILYSLLIVVYTNLAFIDATARNGSS